MPRPAIAEVNLSAILANYQLACRLAPDSQTLAVVKANAYGHGAVKVSQYLQPHVPAFAVASIEEALTLRAADIRKPILLLEGCFAAAELALAAENNFWIMVTDSQQVTDICTTPQTQKLKVWLKIDTGMHRLGLDKTLFQLATNKLQLCDWVDPKIVFASHFSCADELNNQLTHDQITEFHNCIQNASNPEISLANSAAILAHPLSYGSWNRPGYMLYGGKPVNHSNSQSVRSTMTLKSAIIALRNVEPGDTVGYGAKWVATKPSKIATVAIGYGDGYPRQFGNGTPALVKGQRVELAGRVSMDMITLDVSKIDNVRVGDEVILWGNDLPIDELATYADTIGYELITRMTGRVPITYVEE